MWSFDILDEPGMEATLKKLRKPYPEETACLFTRLDSFVSMLNSGLSLSQARTRGWVHDKYKHGMLSLDAGGGKGKAKLRLYILPVKERVVVLVIGAGKKDTQKKDVQSAYAAIEEYLRSNPEKKS